MAYGTNCTCLRNKHTDDDDDDDVLMMFRQYFFTFFCGTISQFSNRHASTSVVRLEDDNPATIFCHQRKQEVRRNLNRPFRNKLIIDQVNMNLSSAVAGLLLAFPIGANSFAPTSSRERSMVAISPSWTNAITALGVLDEGMMGRLENIKRSYNALTERLGDPDVLEDSKLLQKVMSDRASSEDVVMAYDEYTGLLEELAGAKELFQDAGDDPDMKEMARAEIKEIEPQLEPLEEKIKILLLPKDPNDDRNIMLEIRAGTGGSEASIFVGDLLDVYRKYISSQGWNANIIDESTGDDGGYKNIVMEVKGDSVYSKMKWEAGVHRVQRVPATESQGRVHTSTATVAIMPECDEVDINIDKKDIEMSTMRSGGAGGQVS